MKLDDKNIAWVREPELGLAGRSYVLLFLQTNTCTQKIEFESMATRVSMWVNIFCA